MPHVSLKGLAKFMTAGPAGQRKIVRDFKYPKGEGEAQAKYYRDARRVIHAYHRDGHDVDWLQARGQRLLSEASNRTGRSSVRLRENGRAVLDYAGSPFASRNFEVLDSPRFATHIKGVRVSVVPELFVRERGRRKAVKLDFSSRKPKPETPKIICQILFDVFSAEGLCERGSDALYLDVARGSEYKGARIGARLSKDIEAACENFALIWDSI